MCRLERAADAMNVDERVVEAGDICREEAWRIFASRFSQSVRFGNWNIIIWHFDLVIDYATRFSGERVRPLGTVLFNWSEDFIPHTPAWRP